MRVLPGQFALRVRYPHSHLNLGPWVPRTLVFPPWWDGSQGPQVWRRQCVKHDECASETWSFLFSVVTCIQFLGRVQKCKRAPPIPMGLVFLSVHALSWTFNREIHFHSAPCSLGRPSSHPMPFYAEEQAGAGGGGSYLQQEAVPPEIHEWTDIKLYEKTKSGQTFWNP